jgi:hypothetical protein
VKCEYHDKHNTTEYFKDCTKTVDSAAQLLFVCTICGVHDKFFISDK